MRNDVIYRAKRKFDGDWIEGYYAKFNAARAYGIDEYHVIFPLNAEWRTDGLDLDYEEIIPETLCRLLDEPCWNGDRYKQRFFQNDIIAIYPWRHADPRVEEPIDTALVINEDIISKNGSGLWFPQDTTTVRVIGNAYDNPELLQGHDKSRFIRRFGECPDDYYEQHCKLTKKYGIDGAHAGCYICNFENNYYCHQWQGGCDRIDICRKIKEDEDSAAIMAQMKGDIPW